MNRNGLRQLHRSVGLTTWERAAALSTQANDSDGNIRSQINQAQALQQQSGRINPTADLDLSLGKLARADAIAPDHCD